MGWEGTVSDRDGKGRGLRLTGMRREGTGTDRDEKGGDWD